MTQGEFSFIELSSSEDRLKWSCTQGKEQKTQQDRYICLNIYSCGCNNAEHRSVIVTDHTLYAKGPGFDLQVKCSSKQDFYDIEFRFLQDALLK
jgi:hypothetical protein